MKLFKLTFNKPIDLEMYKPPGKGKAVYAVTEIVSSWGEDSLEAIKLTQKKIKI